MFPIPQNIVFIQVVKLSVGICLMFFLVGCGCSASQEEYIDVEVGLNRELLVAEGESVVFQDQGGNLTVLNCSAPVCEWTEYYDSYPACTYIRYEYCTQDVNVLSGENGLRHMLSASSNALWFEFDQFNVSSWVNNTPNDHGYSRLDSLVLFDTTYYNVTWYDVTDTTFSIDALAVSARDKVLQIQMNDGTLWSRQH